MGDDIGSRDDKSGSKYNAIDTHIQYDKETLPNISKTVQNDLRLKILDPKTIKNIW